MPYSNLEITHYYKETEKAVCFEVEIEYELLVSSLNNGTKTRKAFVWIPKSHLNELGQPAAWIWNKNIEAKIDELNPYPSNARGLVDVDYKVLNCPNFDTHLTEKDKAFLQRKKEAFENAVKYREELIAKLKAKGVKGVHNRLKTATLEKLAKENHSDTSNKQSYQRKQH